MSSLRADKRAAVAAVVSSNPKRPLKDVVFPFWFYPCFAISCLASLGIAGGLAWVLWKWLGIAMTWLIGRGGW
jgi:hypothetical protein